MIAALVGGRTPAIWAARMALGAEIIRDLHRRTVWVAALAMACPLLNDEPLIGNILPALTAPLAPATQPGAIRRRPRPAAAPAETDDLALRAVQAETQSSPDQQGSLAPRPASATARRVAGGLSRRAGQDLLRALAKNHDQPAPIGALVEQRRRVIHPWAPAAAETRPHPPQPHKVTSHAAHEWLAAANQRAVRILQDAMRGDVTRSGTMVAAARWPGAAPVAAMAEFPLSGPIRSATGWPSAVPQAAMTELLANGPVAPAELLARLAMPVQDAMRGAEDGPESIPTLRTTPGLSEPHLQGDRQARDTVSARGRPLSQPIYTADAEEVRTPLIPPPSLTPSPGLAPALASERLALAPPQAPGQPSPRSATVIAELGTRAETLEPDDDLLPLATAIKRILDEEARRHGIDV